MGRRVGPMIESNQHKRQSRSNSKCNPSKMQRFMTPIPMEKGIKQRACGRTWLPSTYTESTQVRLAVLRGFILSSKPAKCWFDRTMKNRTCSGNKRVVSLCLCTDQKEGKRLCILFLFFFVFFVFLFFCCPGCCPGCCWRFVTRARA